MGKGGMSSQGGALEAHVEQENMAAWLVGVNTLRIQPFKLPTVGPNDVRVKIKAVGICGSDVHYLKTMKCADFVVQEPMVIGHECAGIVDEVGSLVKNLVPGDRVALEPGISCWRCEQCKGGRYNLCPDMKFFATPPVHGSLANQIVHPADLCFKLPENVSLEEGAMCEPLSVGVHACRRANIGPETNVLVIGAGPIGLVSVLSARAFGAARIVIVDVDDERLSIAKSLGADDAVKVSTNPQDLEDEVSKISKAMKGGVDVSFDCVGFNKTMSTALSATRPGGKVCLVGMGHGVMTVPLTTHHQYDFPRLSENLKRNPKPNNGRRRTATTTKPSPRGTQRRAPRLDPKGPPTLRQNPLSPPHRRPPHPQAHPPDGRLRTPLRPVHRHRGLSFLDPLHLPTLPVLHHLRPRSLSHAFRRTPSVQQPSLPAHHQSRQSGPSD